MVAGTGVRVSVLSSAVGTGLCVVLWLWRRNWIGLGVDWMVSDWALRLLPSVVGWLGWAVWVHGLGRLESRRLRASAWRNALLECAARPKRRAFPGSDRSGGRSFWRTRRIFLAGEPCVDAERAFRHRKI